MVKPKRTETPKEFGSAIQDSRFTKVHTDPRFLKPRRDDTKVVVDERFKELFTDQPGRKRDKYGRKLEKGQSEADHMKRFYRLDEEEEEDKDEEDEEKSTKIDYARGEGDLDSSSDEESSNEEEEEEEESDDSDEEEGDVMIGPSTAINKAKKMSTSRYRYNDDDDEDDDGMGSDVGEIDLDEDLDEKIYAQLDAQAQRAIEQGAIEGESSDEEKGATTSSSKSKEKSKVKAKSKTKNVKSKKDTIPTGDDSRRLAVVNLDWDHIRAKDLYKVFSSIVSSNVPLSSSKGSVNRHGPAVNQVRGSLLHVRVYPSDFGKERMEKEDIEGPPKEIFKDARNNIDSDEDDKEITATSLIQLDEGGDFDEEALRTYQLDRLRYYYAVATFDSKQTARHVYNEIDGTEMERTANVLDLRFVPDEMEFPDGEEGREAEFRDEATEEVSNYKAVDFKTDALRHSRVKLTWDQDDPERSKLTRLVSRGGLTKEQLREDDFKAYLASDPESEEEVDEKQAAAGRERFRALFRLDDDGNVKGKKNGGVFDDTGDDDDDDQDGRGQGDMEITFMPGLSEAVAKKAKGEKKTNDQDETTLEKYLRKQKEKKEKRKSKKAEEDNEEGGGSQSDRDEVVPNSAQAGFDDPFFASDQEDNDFEATFEAEFGEGTKKNANKSDSKNSKVKKKQTRQQENVDPEEEARQTAQLELLIGDNDEEVTADGRPHFDMKDILRAESGKDAKRQKLLKRLSKKKRAEEEEFQARKGKPLTQDTFDVDTKDERFTSLMEDHRYAIDPSHPSFVKTKAMEKLMQERRKKLDEKHAYGEQAGNQDKAKNKETKGSSGDAELAALVNKLKRRSAPNAQAENQTNNIKKKKKAKT